MTFKLRSAALLLCLVTGVLTACGGSGDSSSGGGGGGGGGDNNPPPPATVAVTGVSLNQSTLNLTVGGSTATLTATVEPGNATNKNISFSSDAPGIASVNASTGVVTPVAAGSAKITVTTADGNKTASSTVTVTAAAPPPASTPIITSFTPVEAHHGDTVAINGTGFSTTPAQNKVTFNGHEAAVTSATATQLQVTVPKNLDAGGRVQVTVANQTATATQSFEYLVTYMVSTLAGGVRGYVDDTGEAARFDWPSDIALDAEGNLIVVDNQNNRLRKVTPEGVVTTLTNNPEQFTRLGSVALSAVGNIYVTDGGYRYVHKVTPDGMVAPLAGSGVLGYKDGVGELAQFTALGGIAVSAAGDVYVTDTDHIRMITTGGDVSTFAGGDIGFRDGPVETAQFRFPYGIVVDGTGNLFVADSSNQRIRMISAAGIVTTLAGDGDGTAGVADGTGTQARFNSPRSLAIDAAGNLYVGEIGNGRIRKIAPGGVVTTVAGSITGYAEGAGSTARFNWPVGLAVDAAGNIYVADSQNYRIRKITPE